SFPLSSTSHLIVFQRFLMIKQLILWFPIILPLYVLRFTIGPLPTTALECAFLLLVICVTWKNGWGVWRDGFARTTSWRDPALLWILATIIAVAVAPNHLAAFGLWRAYVLEPMVFALLLAGTMRDEKDREDVVAALVVAVTCVAGWSVLQYLGILPIPHPWDTDFLTRRATGPFPFPNAVSLFCAPIAALCIGRLVWHRESDVARTVTCVAWLGFIAGTLATVLAKSVGGFLAILLTTFLALVWNKKTRCVAVISAILIVIAMIATPRIRVPVVSYLTFNEWSGKVRLITWRETWTMLQDRPIFGTGFGAYKDAMAPYHRATAIEIFQYPHNMLLNLWSETGLLGILAFGWICVTWIRQSKAMQTSFDFRLSTLLPLIAILIHGFVDVPYFKNDLVFVFWIFAVFTLKFPTPLPA
ncbi:MAG: O-antigen ligase family protein, partial [Patescibacteria group bacterium]